MFGPCLDFLLSTIEQTHLQSVSKKDGKLTRMPAAQVYNISLKKAFLCSKIPAQICPDPGQDFEKRWQISDLKISSLRK